VLKLHISKFGQGPNLALLHGWGSSSKIWQPLIAQLSNTFQVWCVDLPGHGDSHAVKWDCSSEQGVEMLANSLPQTFSIVGWSLGGLAAQLLAKQFPQRITKLMLISSTPKFVASRQWPHGMQENTFINFSQQYLKAPQQTLQKFCALQVLNSNSAKQTLSVLVRALSNQRKHTEKIHWGLRWLEEIDLRTNAILRAFPIDLLHGESDKVSSIDAAEQMAASWENTKLARVKHAGHAPFISHPNDFLQWIERGIQH